MKLGSFEAIVIADLAKLTAFKSDYFLLSYDPLDLIHFSMREILSKPMIFTASELNHFSGAKSDQSSSNFIGI